VTRTLIVIAAFLTLSLPAALAAPPEGKGKPESPGKSAAAPGQSAEKAAAKAAKKRCQALRKTDPAAYRAQCPKAKKAKDETEDESEADEEAREDNAAKKCKAERERIGVEEFRKLYAPPNHPNGANAFGKCVSKLSKEKNASG
jgi:hypothetical protein